MDGIPTVADFNDTNWIDLNFKQFCIHYNIRFPFIQYQMDAVVAAILKIISTCEYLHEIDHIDSSISGCIIWYGMGVGKSIISLTAALFYKFCMMQSYGKILIISPAHLVQNWKGEVQKLMGNAIGTLIIDEKEDAIQNMADFNSSDPAMCMIAIVSVTILADLVTTINIESNHILILDEAHLLSPNDNIEVKKLNHKIRIAVTGTLVQNRLEDIWEIATLVRTSESGSAAEFLSSIVHPMDAGKTGYSQEGHMTAHNKLFNYMQQMVIYKSTEECLSTICSLPRRREFHVIHNMSAQQNQMYMLTIDTEGHQSNRLHTWVISQAVTMKLRQICDSTVLGKTVISGIVDTAPIMLPVLESAASSLIGSAGSTVDSDPACSQESIISQSSAPPPVVLESTGSSADIPQIAGITEEVYNKAVSESSRLRLLATFIPHLLASTPGSKIVLVCTFTFTANICFEMAKRLGFSPLRIAGTRQSEDLKRQDAVDLFNDESSVNRVIVIMVQAGGTGFSFTCAQFLIRLGTEPNPAVDIQALYRNYRANSQVEAFVFWLLLDGTIEAYHLVDGWRKRKLADVVKYDYATSQDLSPSMELEDTIEDNDSIVETIVEQRSKRSKSMSNARPLRSAVVVAKVALHSR